METSMIIDSETGVEVTPLSLTDTVSLCIEKYKATDEFNMDTYNTLHALCASMLEGFEPSITDLKPLALQAAEHVESELGAGEIAFIEANFTEEQRKAGSTKSGKLKVTKFLPNAYRSAKSVILNGIANGVQLFDANGEALGKSAIQDAVNEGKGGKTDQQRLDAALDAVIKYASRIYPDARIAVTLWKDASTLDERSNGPKAE